VGRPGLLARPRPGEYLDSHTREGGSDLVEVSRRLNHDEGAPNAILSGQEEMNVIGEQRTIRA
jgi:hypothetical protein